MLLKIILKAFEILTNPNVSTEVYIIIVIIIIIILLLKFDWMSHVDSCDCILIDIFVNLASE